MFRYIHISIVFRRGHFTYKMVTNTRYIISPLNTLKSGLIIYIFYLIIAEWKLPYWKIIYPFTNSKLYYLLIQLRQKKSEHKNIILLSSTIEWKNYSWNYWARGISIEPIKLYNYFEKDQHNNTNTLDLNNYSQNKTKTKEEKIFLTNFLFKRMGKCDLWSAFKHVSI